MARKPTKSAAAGKAASGVKAPDNVVLTDVAALALARKFLGWQCRSRQWAVRHGGGRPSEAMRPRVSTRNGDMLADRLVDLGRCVLEFEESPHAFRLPCTVRRLAQAHARYQATFWHNRLFNPQLPPDAQVLLFQPDWAHAKDLSPDAA